MFLISPWWHLSVTMVISVSTRHVISQIRFTICLLLLYHFTVSVIPSYSYYDDTICQSMAGRMSGSHTVIPSVSNQENDNLFTPRPLFDGIMFIMACDVDFILKCEWIHISGGSTWNVYLSKTKVHHEMTHRHSIHNVCRTLSCVRRKKLFEFLKYNNICSLIAIVNESISKLCGLSTKYAQIWGTLKITPCNFRSSTEYEARVVWMNDASQTKIR